MKRRQKRARAVPALDKIQDGQSVDEHTVALILGMSVQWVRKQRLLKQGPRWIRLGRSVRYSVAELRTWQGRAAKS
jgi:predicted DNA-binding transcriptional regulator AlpA